MRRQRHQMQYMRVRQHRNAEHERETDPREEIAHHRILRPEPGTGEHAARFRGMARAQQV